MCPDQAQQALRRAAPLEQTRPAVDDFDGVFALASAFTLEAEDLPYLSPVAVEKAVEIGAGHNRAPFDATMAFLDVRIGLPRLLVGLRIFKKQLQIGTGNRRIVFHDHNHLSACALD